MTDMNRNRNALREDFFNWISFLRVNTRAAVTLPLLDEASVAEARKYIDRDFERWVAGDLLVTRNPASRYGERSPGYMTRSGLGSLEIGAADD
jgi:hypothetical protein